MIQSDPPSGSGGHLYGDDEVEALNACDTARPERLPPETPDEIDALAARFAYECTRTAGVPDSVLNHQPAVKS